MFTRECGRQKLKASNMAEEDLDLSSIKDNFYKEFPTISELDFKFKNIPAEEKELSEEFKLNLPRIFKTITLAEFKITKDGIITKFSKGEEIELSKDEGILFYYKEGILSLIELGDEEITRKDILLSLTNIKEGFLIYLKVISLEKRTAKIKIYTLGKTKISIK